MESIETVKLTQTVQKGGCAAKVPALELRAILNQVRFPKQPSNGLEQSSRLGLTSLFPKYLIDSSSFDDASVIALSPDVALVQTIDFFTPIVDSPKRFGRIAAANALSDIYAMGGRPLTALGVLAYPTAAFHHDVVAGVLQGASEQLEAARCTLSGGHSIDDDTLKFGLSVTGLVHPNEVWSNAGAKPGDVLILTKGLGTGTITAGLKRQGLREDSEWVLGAMQSMETLNNAVDQIDDLTPAERSSLMRSVHAATDITGFGLSGHAMQMAKASSVQLRIHATQLPLLAGARECLELGYSTKAHRTNREYTASALQLVGTRAELDEQILFDPQTSGGLLLAISPQTASSWLTHLKKEFKSAVIVGTVDEFKPEGASVVFEWT